MIKYKNVLIYGYGKSGKSVEKVLINHNISYRIADEKKLNNDRQLVKLNKKNILNFDLIVLSPGISIYNKLVKFAIRNKIEVISELEFGYRLKSKNTKIIAITGTNGKTTTVAMLNNILTLAGYKSVAAGNIGLPFTDVASCEYDYIVCEVSSFQLESVKEFTANISCIINIDKDHLDRHKTMANYINCKMNVFNNFNKKSVAVINFDDDYSSYIQKRLSCKKVFVSKFKPVKGCFLQNEYIKYKSNATQRVLCKDSIKLPKVYLDNVLIVCAVTKLLKIDTKNIIEGVESYINLPHRQEYLKLTTSKTIINDSKATNPHASLACINSLDGAICLLLGGKNKGISFKKYFKSLPSNVTKIIAFGSARKEIIKAAKKYKYKNIYSVKKLQDACELAIKISVDMDELIVFSPACSSQDEFENYIERGEFFKNTMYDILGRKNE